MYESDDEDNEFNGYLLPFFKMLIFILKLVQQHLIVKTLGNKVRSFDIKYYIK